MAAIKTQKNNNSVEAFLQTVESQENEKTAKLS
jgi:hypothetical protein